MMATTIMSATGGELEFLSTHDELSNLAGSECLIGNCKKQRAAFVGCLLQQRRR
jgi:hypothetical protein